MNEKEISKETPKEPKIQKFYKLCGLIQKTLLIIAIILGLPVIGGFLKLLIPYKPNINFYDNNIANIVSNIKNLFGLIGLSISILLIIIGLVLYILYFFNSGSGEGGAGSPHAFRLGMKA